MPKLNKQDNSPKNGFNTQFNFKETFTLCSESPAETLNGHKAETAIKKSGLDDVSKKIVVAEIKQGTMVAEKW